MFCFTFESSDINLIYSKKLIYYNSNNNAFVPGTLVMMVLVVIPPQDTYSEVLAGYKMNWDCLQSGARTTVEFSGPATEGRTKVCQIFDFSKWFWSNVFRVGATLRDESNSL